MDPSHLFPDELQYELQLRNISSLLSNPLERLRIAIISEEHGEVEDPTDSSRLTRQTVSRELKECDKKLVEISQYINEAVRKADDEFIIKGQSRVYHISRRVLRLATFAPEHTAVSRLLERTRELDRHILTVQESQGAGEQGATALPEILEDLEELVLCDVPEATGAIRKTTVPKPVHSQLNPRALSYTRTNPNVIPSTINAPNHPGSRTRSVHEGTQSIPTRSMGSLSNFFDEEQHHPQPNLAPSVRNFFDDPAVLDARSQSVPEMYNQPRQEVTRRQEPRRATYQENYSNRNQTYNVSHPPYQQPQLVNEDRQERNVERANSNSSDHRSTFSRQEAAGLAGGHRIRHWQLRYSGSPTDIDVEDFIFRVERQAQLNGVSHQALAIGIGELLTDRAAKWYWTYQRNGVCNNWNELKQGLLRRYAPRKPTDNEIRAKIERRKQQVGETFADFCQDIEEIAVKLVRRMDEEELIEVLRRNMHMSLRKVLCYRTTHTLGDLLECCREYEKLCLEEERSSQYRQPREARIQELNYHAEPHQNVYGRYEGMHNERQEQQFEGDEYIEAIVPDKIRVCWNCKDLGHVFTECNQPRVGLFCWSCGTSGVTKPQCIKCTGNAKKDERTTGALRPMPLAPGLIPKSQLSRPPPAVNAFNQPPPPVNQFCPTSRQQHRS